MKIDQHAYKVVEGFKSSLTTQQLTILTNENFEQLHILVEAALAATAENTLHDVVIKVEQLAKQIDKQSSSIGELEG